MFSISRKPVALLAAGAVVGSFGMAQAGSAHAATPMVRINPANFAALQSQLPAKQFSSISRLLKLNPAVLAGLTPQPLPPLRINAGMLSKIAKINPAILAGLNPQPLPPVADAPSVVQPKGDEVALNPQPLPPVAASPGRTPAIPPGQLKVDQLQVKNLQIPVLQG